MNSMKQDWFSNVRNDLLAGLVVALALIPEAIAFSIIAGVDPKVGLYASFCIAVVIAFVGGRPGMISAATGAMALLMVTLVRITVSSTCLPQPYLQVCFRSLPVGCASARSCASYHARCLPVSSVRWQS